MSTYHSPRLSIKAWAEQDRPREKMMQQGRHTLSDAELLAILLGSGNTEETAVDLAKRILSDADNNLNKLGRASIHDLMKNFKGIGEAKAITIVAALELGRRRKDQPQPENPKISSSSSAFDILYPKLVDLDVEHFYTLYLNRRNEIILEKLISTGGIHGTVADIKVILKYGIQCGASAMILAHNHPSGNLKPSEQDKLLTKKAKEAGNLMEMQVQDHIIIAGNKYLSFADEGLL